MVGNAEVIPVALQRPVAARTGFRNVGRYFLVQIAKLLVGLPQCGPRFSEIKSLEDDNVEFGTRARAPALRGPCPNRLDERARWKGYRSSSRTPEGRLSRGPVLSHRPCPGRKLLHRSNIFIAVRRLYELCGRQDIRQSDTPQ